MENQNTNNETVVVPVNNELQVLIDNSGVEIQEAQAIAKNYLPFIERNNDLNVRMEKINFDNPAIGDDKIAREIRLLKVKVRTDADKVNKTQKQPDMIRADYKQTLYNHIKKGCESDEAKLEAVEKFIENAEKKRINDLQIERVALLLPYNESAELMQLGAMPEQMWNDTFEGAKLVHQKKIDDARIAEEKRVEELRIEKERQDAIEKENAKLKAEAEAKELEMEAERKKQAEILAEQQRIAKEKEAKAEAIRVAEQKKADELLEQQRKIADKKIADEKAARLKVEKELAEKKAAEAKIAADKIKADEAALLEKRKQELAPDKQKLIAMIEGMIIIIPKLQSNESKDVSEQIDNKFEGFKNWSIEQINTLS